MQHLLIFIIVGLLARRTKGLRSEVDGATWQSVGDTRSIAAEVRSMPIVRIGRVVAEGRWVSGRKRVFVAESRLVDEEGDEIGRGTGTFMRSHIPLSSLPGYLAES